MELGEKLKSARIKAGLTQEQVADNLHISKMQIIRYEKDRQEPTATRLKELCLLYGVSADSVLGIGTADE